MNKKFLYRDKALLYAKQNRLSAFHYAALSTAMYDSIVKETEYYNTKLAGGKWNNMMSMKPRNLPVFQTPDLTAIQIDRAEGWNIAPEGFVRKDSSLLPEAGSMTLPAFDDVHKQKYFIDVYLTAEQSLLWTANARQPWIRLSHTKGTLLPGALSSQVRIQVDIDWTKAPKQEQVSGQIVLKGGRRQMIVEVRGRRLNNPDLTNYKGFVENNGLVSVYAVHTSRNSAGRWNQWKVVEGLGYTGSLLQSTLQHGMEANISADTSFIKNNSAIASYDFYIFTAAPASINVFTLPTHPLNNKLSMRYAVSVDDGPLQLVDFRTFGRSEEWKQNVLTNRASRKIQVPFLNKGKHVLKIYAIDPGVLVDEIRVDLGGLKKAYSVLQETN